MNNVYDVIIIGGGASGLMCASYLLYLKPSLKVMIIERNKKIGTKLLITGNGRCNLTNTSIAYVDYSTDNYSNLESIISTYSVDKTLDYFENTLGVHLTYKENLVYPFSNKSSTVVDSFRLNLEGRIDIVLDDLVKSTSSTDDIFEVITINSRYSSRNIVFAGGGSAAPKTGSDGNIYKLILPYANRSDFTQVIPSLVQLKTLDSDAHLLAGTRVKAEITLMDNKIFLGSSSGELMFTDYGLSGICVFDISGYYNRAILEGKKNLYLSINLMPGEDVDDIINNRCQSFPDRSMNDILSGFFTKELSDLIVKRSDGSLQSIISTIRNLNFIVSGTLGFDNAQVTAGGLNLSSLDKNCKLSNGVYVIGEAVNVDGPCGGYNLQWAWSSAMAAASGIVGE